MFFFLTCTFCFALRVLSSPPLNATEKKESLVVLHVKQLFITLFLKQYTDYNTYFVSDKYKSNNGHKYNVKCNILIHFK